MNLTARVAHMTGSSAFFRVGRCVQICHAASRPTSTEWWSDSHSLIDLYRWHEWLHNFDIHNNNRHSVENANQLHKTWMYSSR